MRFSCYVMADGPISPVLTTYGQGDKETRELYLPIIVSKSDNFR